MFKLCHCIKECIAVDKQHVIKLQLYINIDYILRDILYNQQTTITTATIITTTTITTITTTIIM